VGKTTVTLGLISALRRRGLTVQPFKVGPDFIDPGHHSRATGRVSRNLDGWMLSRDTNLALFRRHAAAAQIAVVEGVMGLFDGYDGLSEAGSTAEMAKWLNLPALLVVDARSLARSAAALVHGYATFDRELTLAGVVFNRVGSAAHLHYLEQALSGLNGINCIGGLPREADLAIPERHLGLFTTEDHPLDESRLTHLADFLEENLDLDGLLAALPVLSFSRETPVVEASPFNPRPLTPDPWPLTGPLTPGPSAVRLGVARDPAFCFYYQENLELLAQSGAELVPFSPLADRELPENLHGVYLGGGYPELYATQLAANAGMKRSIAVQAAAGLPVYAECGGLMYLSREIEDLEGRRHPMAGVLPLSVRMLPRLKALGYREITLTGSGLLGPKGTKARGHEFHYSEIAAELEDLPRLYKITARQGQETAPEGYSVNNVLASYVHLHFGSNPAVARHLVERCLDYKVKVAKVA